LARLPRLTGKNLGKIVEKLGFEYLHPHGSHLGYKHTDGRRVVIPHHLLEEIGPGLLIKIIKRDFQISREEFMQYL
jgi:predicted RNA binding protein YcfA (HicA-like mRNA interferase family)